jgi:hypothetical protein
MNPADRNRRALIILAVVSALVLVWYFTSDDGVATIVSASTETIPAAEKRLERLKQLAATVPGKQTVLDQVSAELAAREKGLITAATAPQAQAQLLQIVLAVAKGQPNPINMRNTEMALIKPFDDNYGEVSVAVNFEAGIEQLINFLSDLTARKELIGTSDVRIGAANPKQKTMPVRITVSALVRRDLIPEKKGGTL